MFKQHFFPSASWQSFRAPLDISSGTVVAFDPYQTPSYIWIRKALWHTTDGYQTIGFKPGRYGIVEELYGMTRLTILGPNAVNIQFPSGGSGELELEFLIQSSPTILKKLIGDLWTLANKEARRI